MDKERAKAFMSTMIETINAGSIAMMMSIGHRTGLFDVMAGKGHLTSAELATAASLDERYVREWLAAMASGGIVDFDAHAETFELPIEHQALVTRAGGQMNLAANMQNISLLGSVEDDIVEAFITGAGVPYSRYPGFQGLMAEVSAARFDAALITEMLPLIPGVVDALNNGATLADVGCGSGHAVLLMAKAFPNSTFVGIDFSDDGLEAARLSADAIGLSNVTFIGIDASQMDFEDSYDFITSFDAIHDQAQPEQVLKNIRRALVPGGYYLCAEPRAHTRLEDNMTEPMAPYQYTISTMHCMSVSIAGGGEGLGTCWGATMTEEYLSDAGLTHIETTNIKADRANTYFLSQKP